MGGVSWGTGRCENCSDFTSREAGVNSSSLEKWKASDSLPTQDGLWGFVSICDSTSRRGAVIAQWEQPTTARQWINQHIDALESGKKLLVASGYVSAGAEGYSVEADELFIQIQNGLVKLELHIHSCEDWGITNGKYKTYREVINEEFSA